MVGQTQPMERFELRPATSADEPLLTEMLRLAAGWRADAAAELDARTAMYVRGYGRPGDAGVVAERGGTPLGAAWYRRFSADEALHGFVDATIPELAIAVRREARGTGAGRALLEELIGLAARDGLPGLSLSVEKDNPARRLYERAGFETVRETDTALTMVRRLP
jgi:ribosomal protein S18 acetylase RimI-like enzyme